MSGTLLLLALGVQLWACTPIGEFDKKTSTPGTSDVVETSDTSAQSKRDAAMPTQADDAPSVMVGSAECATREAGDLFCDADAKRQVCISASASRAVPCGDLERCVVLADRAECRCVPGAVSMDSQCVMGTSCAVDNGGCDTLTMCMATAGGRTCGGCPDGYAGDGLQGCAPQLLRLQASCGTLEPPLAAGVYDYHLRVPLTCHALKFSASAPLKTRLTVNGAELAGEALSWSLSPVKFGESAAPISVTSEFGVSSKYNIVVERSGAQEAYIKASNAEAGDKFGYSVTAAPNELFVGAPWEDSASSDPANNAAADSGAAYVFVRKADGWEQQLFLKPSSVVAGDAFGASLVVAGDTLFVSATGGDPLQWYGGASIATRSGSVYVFARKNGSWEQQARLSPSAGSAGDMFGFGLALHDKTLVVGAPGDSSGGLSKSGAVYTFQLEGGAWVEKQKLPAPTAPYGGSFGLSVSIDADKLLVGAPGDSMRDNLAGAAYLFMRQGAQWKLDQRLDPRSSTANATFGWQVAVRGDMALVTSPGVVRVGPPGALHIFDHSAGTWTLRDTKSAAYPADANLFGGGLDLSDSMLIVGANGDSSGASGIDADASRMDAYQSGAVYLFALSDAGWVPTTYIKPSYPDPDDQFGVQVAHTEDSVVVGAPSESGASRKINGDADSNSVMQSGAVYVFR